VTDEARDRVDMLLDAVRDHDPRPDLALKAVSMRLRRAAHLVDTEIRRRLGPQGMELWEVEILANLVTAGGTMTAGALQNLAQLTPGAITHRVTKLEDAGHVVRTISPADRRQIDVSVTSSGRARMRQVSSALSAIETPIC